MQTASIERLADQISRSRLAYKSATIPLDRYKVSKRLAHTMTSYMVNFDESHENETGEKDH